MQQSSHLNRYYRRRRLYWRNIRLYHRRRAAQSIPRQIIDPGQVEFIFNGRVMSFGELMAGHCDAIELRKSKRTFEKLR